MEITEIESPYAVQHCRIAPDYILKLLCLRDGFNFLLVFSFCFFIKVVHTGECPFCTGLSLRHYITVGLIASCVLLCCFILGPEGILSKKYECYLEDNPKMYAYKLKFERHFSAEFMPTLFMVG
jgi:hypothetical protein